MCIPLPIVVTMQSIAVACAALTRTSTRASLSPNFQYVRFLSECLCIRNNTFFQLIPGHEAIGQVVQIGRNVKDFEIGDRVVADVGIFVRDPALLP